MLPTDTGCTNEKVIIIYLWQKSPALKGRGGVSHA